MIRGCFKYVFLVFLVGLKFSYGQDKQYFIIIQDQQKIMQEKDSIQSISEVKKIISEFRSLGFLEAGLDSVSSHQNKVEFFIHKGAFLDFSFLSYKASDKDLLENIGIKNSSKPLNYFQHYKSIQKILDYLENNGYPFSTIYIDSLSIDQKNFSGRINIDKGPLILIDSLIIKGNSEQPITYISNYTGIKTGGFYNETLISELETRLKELPFLKISKGPEVEFINNKAKIYIYADKLNANQFDGVAGLQPDPNTNDISITGELRLKMINAIKRAESIEINWKRAQTQTQEILASVGFPVILKSPFGADAGIKVYKRDTTFTDINLNAGITYSLKAGRQVRVFTSRRSSYLLSSTSPILPTAPEFADVDLQSFGIGLKEEHLDYRINPRKGYKIFITGSAGVRNIRKDPDLPEAAYSGIEIQSTQTLINFHGDVFIPVRKRSTILGSVKASGLQGQKIFKNEQLRFGGFRTLRGIDEESIFADHFAVSSLEYRFLTDENAHLFVFFDQAYYKRSLIIGSITDYPWGTGAGITFQSKAGIFSISYAVGNQFNNPLNLRAAKIHFGLVNYF